MATTPASFSGTLAPETVRGTPGSSGLTDASFLQNLATFAGGGLVRPSGNMFIDPSGNMQGSAQDQLTMGNAPVQGSPYTLLQWAQGGNPFTTTPPTATVPPSGVVPGTTDEPNPDPTALEGQPGSINPNQQTVPVYGYQAPGNSYQYQQPTPSGYSSGPFLGSMPFAPGDFQTNPSHVLIYP